MLPDPPDSFLNEIQVIFFKFLWSNKPDKIKRKVMKGGNICMYSDYGYGCSPDADKYIPRFYGWVCYDMYAQLKNKGTI